MALGGLNAAVAGIGTALAGPLLGAAADRLGQRRVLVPLGLLNAVLGVVAILVGQVLKETGSDVPGAFLLGAREQAEIAHDRLHALSGLEGVAE